MFSLSLSRFVSVRADKGCLGVPSFNLGNTNSATGTRTRVARVRAEYPNQLDYSGSCNVFADSSRQLCTVREYALHHECQCHYYMMVWGTTGHVENEVATVQDDVSVCKLSRDCLGRAFVSRAHVSEPLARTTSTDSWR